MEVDSIKLAQVRDKVKLYSL